MSGDDRAVAPVVGYVILFGLVGIASVSLLVAGSGFVADSQQQMEQERVEQSFTELSQRIETEAASPDMGAVAELDAGDHGTVTKENSAFMEVSADNLNKDITINIGTVEWTNDAGTTVAYQGGGVFRNPGNETQIISSPSIRYDVESETLTMPVYDVTGGNSLSSGTVRLEHESVTPVNKVSNWKEHNVSIYIESEYYMGWKEYFEQQGGDTIVTDYGSLNGDNGYVEIDLGFGTFEDSFADGVSYSDTCEANGNGQNNNTDCDKHGWEISEGDPSPPMDEVVDRMINDPEGAMGQDFDDELSGADLNDLDTTFEDEYVLIDGDLEDGNISVDLTEGNTTLAVDGNVENTDITVTENDPDHSLHIYVSGNLLLDNSNVCVESCPEEGGSVDGTAIQLFGTSDMGIQFGTGDDVTYEGLLYAASNENSWDHVDVKGSNKCGSTPLSDVQLCAHSNPDIYGGVVVNSANFQGGGGINVNYDSDIDTTDIAFRQDLLPPRIAYLNVVEHKISVENE